MRLDLLKTFRYWLSTFTEIRPEVQLKQCCLVRSGDKIINDPGYVPKDGSCKQTCFSKVLGIWDIEASCLVRVG